jgi:hypothetical protein
MVRKVAQFAILVFVILILLAPAVLAQAPTGDRLVIGQSFVLPAGEELNGNLVVLGGSATLEESSVVRGDVAVFGGSATVAGTVQGNLAVFGGSTTLEDSAVIEGNLATFGGSVSRAPDAVVSGEVFQGLPVLFPLLSRFERGFPLEGPWPPVQPAPRVRTWGILGSFFAWQLRTLGTALFLALLGVVIVVLAPKAIGRISSAASRATLESFGLGLLTLLVGLLLGLLLLIACCLGLVVWLALGVAWLVGWVAVGLWLGQRLLHALSVRNLSSVGEVALGVFLITVLARFPACIGFFIGVILGCVGLGAVVLTRFGTRSYRGDGVVGDGLQSHVENLPALSPPGPESGELTAADEAAEAGETPQHDDEVDA